MVIQQKECGDGNKQDKSLFQSHENWQPFQPSSMLRYRPYFNVDSTPKCRLLFNGEVSTLYQRWNMVARRRDQYHGPINHWLTTPFLSYRVTLNARKTRDFNRDLIIRQYILARFNCAIFNSHITWRKNFVMFVLPLVRHVFFLGNYILHRRLHWGFYLSSSNRHMRIKLQEYQWS